MATEVEWTPAGKQSLLDGEWKCISSEFYPAGRGGWCDPLDEEHWIENVIEGAALTNIPLMNQLEPVMASAATGDNKPKVFIFASNQKEKNMDLATLRTKPASELNEEEKTFVAQHGADLTAEEQEKFGLEVTKEKKTPEPAKDPKDDPEDPKNKEDEPVPQPQPTEDQEAAVAADLKKKGFTIVSADRLKKLEDTASKYEREDAERTVKAHIARGAIKADQLETWADKIIQDPTNEDLLKSIPDNPVMAASQGKDSDADDATDAIKEADKLAKEKVAADAKDGKNTSYGEAHAAILASNKDLKDRVNAQYEGR